MHVYQIERNGKRYIIEEEHTENRWYLLYRLYEIDAGNVRFLGKVQTMNYGMAAEYLKNELLKNE